MNTNNNVINNLTIRISNSQGTRILDSLNNIIDEISPHLLNLFDLESNDQIILNNVNNAFLEMVNINNNLNINTTHISNSDLEYYNSLMNYASDINDSDSDDFPNINYDRLIDVPIVLDKKKFDTFKIKTATNRYIKQINKDNCTICLDQYKLKDTYITLLCKHNFHEKCIKKWLCENSKKCPTCRMCQE
jgi:hypothetical protein